MRKIVIFFCQHKIYSKIKNSSDMHFCISYNTRNKKTITTPTPQRETTN